MWQLIAPIVRWPLHSPARLVSVVVALLVTVFVAGELNGGGDAAAPAAQEPTATASASLEADAPGQGPQPNEPASSSGTEESPEATASPSTSPEDDLPSVDAATDALSDDPAANNPSAAAADSAAAFVAAWARPDLKEKAWREQVRPLVTKEMWDGGLADTDPARTPDAAVSGEPVQVAINAEEGIFDVPTTSGAWIRVTVSRDGGGEQWLASRVETAV